MPGAYPACSQKLRERGPKQRFLDASLITGILVMHDTKLIITLLCAFLCVASGCASGGGAAPARQIAASGTSAQPSPAPPQGLRLGAQYMSGLNEPCYELYPVDGSLAQPQALCLRRGAWEVVPAIFQNVPSSATGPYSFLDLLQPQGAGFGNA